MSPPAPPGLRHLRSAFPQNAIGLALCVSTASPYLQPVKMGKERVVCVGERDLGFRLQVPTPASERKGGHLASMQCVYTASLHAPREATPPSWNHKSREMA